MKTPDAATAYMPTTEAARIVALVWQDWRKTLQWPESKGARRV